MAGKRGAKRAAAQSIAKEVALAPQFAFVPLHALYQRIGPPPKEEDGPPCHLCSALCCKYFALQIDRPTTPRDHDEVRWYLMHEKVVVWVSEGDWYIEVRTRCKNLQADHSCGIYETRPLICREYGLPEEGPCEYFTQELKYDLFFGSAEEFESWSREDLEKRRLRLERRREKRKAASTSREPVGA